GDSNDLRATVLEMPYKGDAASMFVLLPFKNIKGTSATPLDTMLQRLTKDSFSAIVKNLTQQKVILNFPKFKLEHKITGELTEALQRLGINDLFTGDADLSNYVPGGKLRGQKGIHKAMVEVNEEGSEAAAATGIILPFISPGFQSRPREFICDRPLLFFIYDNQTRNILFMGVYREP
ncbi:hypothetical protein OTU49_003620, partial [Cherax quadricarinatus]